jgi:hypothetical protein
LISSFFQSFHSDEINFQGKKENETTISINSIDKLCLMYENLINNKNLTCSSESIDEISDIFKINIIDYLEKKKNYYFFNHNLFELYILDFNKIIKSESESLIYINEILGIKCDKLQKKNLTTNKNYYDKYIKVKQILGKKLNNIIENQYNSFYFTAFNKNNL